MRKPGFEFELVARTWWTCTHCNVVNSKIDSCDDPSELKAMVEKHSLRACKWCGTVDSTVNEALLKASARLP